MALIGTIIDLGDGRLGFEYCSTLYNEPKTLRQVWALPDYRLSGMSYCERDYAIGRQASITDGVVSCYLGQGNYLTATLVNRGQTPCDICETHDCPPPKRVKSETRWQSGRWEKYSRKGWIAA